MTEKILSVRKLLLAASPHQVTFVVCERLESVRGYDCYYTVVKDKENLRNYQWRRDRIDYEAVAKTSNPRIFWSTQPARFHLLPGTEPNGARVWVQEQFGRFNALEGLLVHYKLWHEFLRLCAAHFKWDKGAGVFTLLPEEIEERPILAADFLKKRLVMAPEEK